MSYRLFGAETSAYSTKMRSYLKYKAFAFDWVPRTAETEDELKRLSRFGTLPVLVTSSGFAVHDTTPMMEALEADSPEPSATPADPALAFLACVLEEYADVWLAKAAFHYRWTRKKDQRLAAQRSIEEYYPSGAPGERKATEDLAIENMTGQLKTMQLDGELGPVVEKSFKKFIKLLDDHLKKHLFIFGDRPSIGDFAIAGQLIQMMKDPTPAKIIEKDGEFVAKWCEFMSAPTASGPFAALDDLKETLAPLFADDLAAFFLPWAAENLENSLAGAETFEVSLGKDKLTLAPLRFCASGCSSRSRQMAARWASDSARAASSTSPASIAASRLGRAATTRSSIRAGFCAAEPTRPPNRNGMSRPIRPGSSGCSSSSTTLAPPLAAAKAAAMPASPAPRKRSFCSASLEPVSLSAPITPASATAAVPWMSSLKVQTLSW